MTASKPESCPHCGGPSALKQILAGPQVKCESCRASGPAIDCSEAISDEDFAAADLEAVNAWNARAADKARIAELEKALMAAKQHITSGPYGAHPALETIARIDAALSQQGKEGECSAK